MDNTELSTIRRRLTTTFIGCLSAFPLIMALFISITMSVSPAGKKSLIMPLVLVPVVLICIPFYRMLTGKLQEYIDRGVVDETSVRFAAMFPLWATLIFALPMVPVTSGLIIYSYMHRVIITPYQVAYYFVIVLLLLTSLSYYHYYRNKNADLKFSIPAASQRGIMKIFPFGSACF